MILATPANEPNPDVFSHIIGGFQRIVSGKTPSMRRKLPLEPLGNAEYETNVVGFAKVMSKKDSKGPLKAGNLALKKCPINLFEYPYDPETLTSKVILDLAEDRASDGFTLIDADALLPPEEVLDRLWEFPLENEANKQLLMRIAAYMERRLDSMLRPKGYTVIAFSPRRRSSNHSFAS